jgi:hypothetical protein
MVINALYHLLICMECQECINPDDPRSHFVHKHKDRKLPKDFNETILPILHREDPSLTYTPPCPTEPVDPIFGLQRPKPNYQICGNCHRGFHGCDAGDNQRRSPSFIAHKCVQKEPNPPHRTFYVSDVQRFGSHPSHAWFPVKTVVSGPLASPPNAWTLYQTRMSSRPEPEARMALPDNYRVLHQFLFKEGWIEHVQNKEIAPLVALTELKPDDPTLPWLNRHIQAHLAFYQSRLRGNYPKRLISTRPS